MKRSTRGESTRRGDPAQRLLYGVALFKAIALSTVITCSSFALADRPERNSFLDYRVTNVNALLREIKTDPAVADRFERHFGMTKSRLISYLSSLHRDTLKKPGVYTVYSIPQDGHVKMHMQKLASGEPVFADPNGAPILLIACGNPLTRGPEVVAQSPGIEAAPAPQATSILQVASPVPPGPGAPEMLLSTPKVPGEMVYTPVVPETLTVPATSAPQSFAGGGGGGSIGSGLGILPIVGGIIWGIGSGGGHHSPPVPEPATVVALGAGIGAMMARRRKLRG